jgi:hypothetical protein
LLASFFGRIDRPTAKEDDVDFLLHYWWVWLAIFLPACRLYKKFDGHERRTTVASAAYFVAFVSGALLAFAAIHLLVSFI